MTNGVVSCGPNMLKKSIGVFCAVGFLSGCGLMPGIQNLDTAKMRKLVVPESISVNPTLIPITPSLIADQRVSTYFYRIAASDVLHINVWEHPEFNIAENLPGTATTPGVHGAAGTSGYLVNSSGRIYFPLIGEVLVADKTVDQIRVEISSMLKKYVPNPQINVRVADFRGQKVYVLGEVIKTGFVPINDQQLTIADALALSGWIDPAAADPRYIYVIRGNYTCPKIFWLDAKTPDRLLLAEHFSLQPRDVLYVSSAPATRWNRVLNQLLPTVQTVWFTKSVVQ